MSGKTRGQKKSEVAEEIEQRAKEGEFVSLKQDVIEEDLSDENFSREEISKMVDELVNESPFARRDLRVQLVYPTSEESDLLSDFELNSFLPTWGKLALGFYLFTMVLYSTNIINQGLNLTNGNIIGVAAVSVVFSFVLGHLFEKTMRIVERVIPRVKQFRIILYPFLGLVSVSYFSMWVGATTYDLPINSTAIASVIPTCLMATAALVTLIKKFDFSQDDYEDTPSKETETTEGEKVKETAETTSE